MINKQSREVWKQLKFPGWQQLRNRYAVSNFGRLASYKIEIPEGKLLDGSLTTGYRTLNLHRPGNKGSLYIHRQIAKIFLKPPTQKHKFIIHLNHDKLDNRVKNLRWVTLEQMIVHHQKSPARIAYKKIQANKTVGLKLDINQVKKIKDILNSPNRTITIKRLAKNYKVSEMTIYRIKSGENWERV